MTKQEAKEARNSKLVLTYEGIIDTHYENFPELRIGQLIEIIRGRHGDLFYTTNQDLLRYYSEFADEVMITRSKNGIRNR